MENFKMIVYSLNWTEIIFGAFAGLLLVSLINVKTFLCRRFALCKLKGLYISKQKYKPHSCAAIIEVKFENWFSNVIKFEGLNCMIDKNDYEGEIVFGKDNSKIGNGSFRHKQAHSNDAYLVGYGRVNVDTTKKNSILCEFYYLKNSESCSRPEIWRKPTEEDIGLTKEQLRDKYLKLNKPEEAIQST